MNKRMLYAVSMMLVLMLGLVLGLAPKANADNGNGIPEVNGRFYGDGDYLIYQVLAESPGEAILYYYLDGTTMYAALVLDEGKNDNAFANKKNNSPDEPYMTDAGWMPGPGHSFNDLEASDHAVWNLFCGGSSWMWLQDLLYDADGDFDHTEPDWLSDPFGDDGGGSPPSSLLASASSLQWNMNYYAANPTLGWDVTMGGTRPYASWISPNEYNLNLITDDGWPTYNATYQWEWRLVYEVALDISVCGGVPLTLWPVTGHNSPSKDGTEDAFFYDWGDNPDTGAGTGVGNYQTSAADNGPRHRLIPTLYMGSMVDAEGDGQPSVYANGDDLNPMGLTDDENGVRVSDLVLTPGLAASVRVTATNQTGVTAYLYGYIDFNGDGDFADAGESRYVTVPTGSTNVVFTLNFGTVPMSFTGPSYARFRLGTVQSEVMVPYGLATNGEVEDYPVGPPTLVAVSDFGAYRQGNRAVVQWSTASEVGTIGFYLLRLDAETGQYVKVSQELLPSVGAPQGGTYRLVDEGAVAGTTYTYTLQEVEARGGIRTYGPYTVAATGPGELIAGSYEARGREVSAEQLAAPSARKAAQAQAKNVMNNRTGKVIKLVVTEPGLYYVPAVDMAGLAGISMMDARALIASGISLQNQGVSVPFLPAGDKSGIYFYGEGIESLYTDENIYWIRRGRAPGMELVKGKGPRAVATAQTFVDRVHLEQDMSAYPALFDDPEDDYWIWDVVHAGTAGWDTRTYTLNTPGAVAGPATLTVHLQGGSDTVAPMDHHVVVSLNGQEVGQGLWDGLTPFDLNASGVTFNDGDNTVVVKGLRDAGVAYSLFYVDSLSASYTRAYRAVDDQLLLRGDGNAVVTVRGFTEGTIWVLDVTNGARPRRVDATTVQKTGNSYSVSFSPASPNAEYLVVTPRAARAPAAMFADVASDLASAAHGADYIVVTPLELKDAAQTLADYRQGKGLATMVVDLEDIYDEFNHGIVSPVAIRTFLTHAYNTWSPRPQYVVLAGEGTYDYKDHMGHADNLVPVWMVSTPHGLFAADNRFVDVVGDDGVPEMAIGRLPAMTAAELTGLIAKITSYEGASGDGWANKVIMLADNPDAAGDFPVTSDGVAALVPPAYAVNKIYLGEVPLAAAKSNLTSALNAGALWFNYIGHGGLDRLANEGLLLTSDVASLSNGAKLPVATFMTCLAGQYAVPGYDAISEVLMLRTGGGAAAVWAPTGLSLNTQAEVLNQALFRAVFQDGEKSLGRAVLLALQEFAARDDFLYHLDIYNLQGDPALEVK